MKFNQWTLGLAAAGVVSLGGATQAEETANHVATALSSTTISGYVSTSAIWKPGTGNALMPGRQFDGTGKQDGFNLDVAKLTIESPLDEGEWAAGYKVDLLFGPDANLYGTTSSAALAGPSDFAIQQAYVALRAPIGNGIDLKMGVFDTIIGYEVFDYGSNPNYSRSYAYFIEPFTHTGLLATYQVNEVLSVAAGVANTVGNSINARAVKAAAPAAESAKTYMGAVTLSAPDDMAFIGGGSLYAGVVNGLPGAAGATGDQTSWYIGSSVPTPLEGLAVGVAYDYRHTSVAPGTSGNWAQAASLYASYRVTEDLTMNVRGEYANGTNGTWGTITPAGTQEKLLGLTLTADYALWDNVITRGEVRWDHDLTGGKVFGGNANADPDKNAISLALNVIYQF
jgi:hypothetical protein